MTTNIYVMTHGDLDGIGCALVLNRAYPEAEMIITEYCNYDDIDEKLNFFLNKWTENNAGGEQDKLFITDICPSKETCERINQLHNYRDRSLDVKLIDHHKTKNWVSKYAWSLFNNTYCATSLVADWANKSGLITYNEGLKKFCDAIDAWDMWRLEDKNRARGEKLNSLVHFIGFGEFLRVFELDVNADETDEFKTLIDYLLRNRQHEVKDVIKKQLHDTPYRMDNFGNTYKILFANRYISEIGNAALEDKDSQDLQYVVIINPVNNTISLRSRRNQDIDVAVIAQKFRDGGGHKHASGFPFAITRHLEEKIYRLLDKIK